MCCPLLPWQCVGAASQHPAGHDLATANMTVSCVIDTHNAVARPMPALSNAGGMFEALSFERCLGQDDACLHLSMYHWYYQDRAHHRGRLVGVLGRLCEARFEQLSVC